MRLVFSLDEEEEEKKKSEDAEEQLVRCAITPFPTRSGIDKNDNKKNIDIAPKRPL